MHKITTEWGLNQLLEYYQKEGLKATSYWIRRINTCLEDGSILDDDDYESTPTPLKKYWDYIR